MISALWVPTERRTNLISKKIEVVPADIAESHVVSTERVVSTTSCLNFVCNYSRRKICCADYEVESPFCEYFTNMMKIEFVQKTETIYYSRKWEKKEVCSGNSS